MVQFNFSERTIKAKVVYYGPPQSGKTTNLEQIHRITDPEGANRLISLNTAQDRTLFFDLLPFSLGTVSGYDFKIQLYTVPGQVQYNATRRVVLAGADAVVFVADSQKAMARENLTAFENMKVNLLANRLVPEKVPLVLQYNKQDLDPLVPRGELDRALNFWGRKAFPAVAQRGEGVVETFVAVVQEMLAAIALKYNLKEKGLDPEAVPEVVAQAFAALLKKAPPLVGTPPPPPKVVISQPEGAEPAYPGQVGPEVSPVSEELLHRAIRSNVELAEALGQLVREVNAGLATIQTQTEALGTTADLGPRAPAVTAIRRETARLRQIMLDLGQSATRGTAGLTRAPAPPQISPTPPRPVSPPAAPVAPAPAVSVPPGVLPAAPRPPLSVVPRPPAPSAPSPVAPVAPPSNAPPPGPAFAPRPLAAPPPPPPASAPAPAEGSAPASLDALLAEVAMGLRPVLAARPLSIQSRVARGAPLPRCSPAGLRRALAAVVQGVATSAEPASVLGVRAERKPVLLRGRDGTEVKRDFLMIAFTHAGGLAETDQQRVLKGGDTGPFGEAHRLVREMGGFVRFAPLPASALETRLFLPV